MSALAKRSLVCQAQIGFAVYWLWLNVCSCVEHILAYRVSALVKRSLVCQGHEHAVCQLELKRSVVCRAQIVDAVCWLYFKYV